MTKLIIPDSGPLILLARINRLDVLDQFEWPIVITDAVKTEVLDGPEQSVDITVLDEWFTKWFKSRQNHIHIHDTTYGYLLNQNHALMKLIPDTLRQGISQRLKMLKTTEFALRELSDNLNSELNDETHIVLFENSDVRNMPFGSNIHSMSIWSFARILENLDMISPDDLFNNEKPFVEMMEISKKREKPMRKLITFEDFVIGYARGEISSGAAVKGIGAYGFRELFELMSINGIPLPRGDGHENIIEKEINDVFPILKNQLDYLEARNAQTDYSR